MDIEPLLQPISADSPCGEDLSYDPAFNDLETLARGKEAQQFSASDDPEWQKAAEEPDWRAIRDKACELFTRSKDLRVAVILTLALLKLEGLPGLRDGLTLIQRLISEQWDGVYPKLDPEDNNDPTERVNIIAGLAKPLATFGDPYRVIERIRQAPLSKSTQMGSFSLADITGLGVPAGSTATAPNASQVEAAFRDSNAEELAGLGKAAADARNTVSDIDLTIMSQVGAGNALSLDELSTVLGEIGQTLSPYLPQDTAASLGFDSGGGDSSSSISSSSSSGGSGAFTGEIKSRMDVLRALDQICDYYRQAEPGNPVPLLLRRAQRLVDKDFMAIMEDLVPDGLAQLSIITGQKREGDFSSQPSEETPSE